VDEILTRFETACRESGLKLTHQRFEIYKELLLATDHPSADTLFLRLKDRFPALSRDTVFRTLSTLADHGLIAKVDTLESVARYEVALRRHHHFICRRCGVIVDFVWPEIETMRLPSSVASCGQVDQTSLVAHGICEACLKSRKQS